MGLCWEERSSVRKNKLWELSPGLTNAESPVVFVKSRSSMLTFGGGTESASL